ncbi:MAG TPA: hypothetical protein VIH90_01405 [Candidatus Saccharimonadales bacterium]
MPNQLEVMPNPTQEPESAIAGNEFDNAARVGSIVSYFNSEFGLSMNESGLLVADPTDQQLDDLKAWHEKTSEDGIIMPDIDTFTAKVVLAQALMPQVDEGREIQYLFGKGVGAELAIQGNVSNRQKSESDTPFRSHSDFEIYAVKDADYSNIEHSDRFRAVFGGQEIYPLDSTKVLRGMSQDFLYDTSEAVDFGGVSFIVPKLELQFVEKLISVHRETELRLRGQTDAELLAEIYPMDRDFVHQVIQEYIIKPELASIPEVEQELGHISTKLLSKLAAAKGSYLTENPQATNSEIEASLGSNEYLGNYLHNQGIAVPFLELADSNTGQLRPDASVSIHQALEAKRAQKEAALMATHEIADSLLKQPA